MRLLLLVSLVVLLTLRSAAAEACTCRNLLAEANFLSFAPTRHLPADAKGVVFIARFSRAWRDDQPTDRWVVEETPPVISSLDFKVTDLTANSAVTLQLKRIGQLPALEDAPFPVFTRTGAPVADLDRRVGLFRVEPSEGFVAGHSYRFEYRPTSGAVVEVIIDEAKVGKLEAGEVAFVAEPVRMAKLSLAGRGGSCGAMELARVQSLHFFPSKRLAAWRDSLVFVTELRDEANRFRRYRYRTSVCEPDNWGRSARSYGEEVLTLSCDREQRSMSWVARGRWGLLELEDSLLETRTVSGTLELDHLSCTF